MLNMNLNVTQNFVGPSAVPRPTRVLSSQFKRRHVISRAQEDDYVPRLSSEDAAKILGVSSSSSFDEVLAKKNALLLKAAGDQERVMELEAAYDVVFMQSMKRRITGETNVSTSVRYADVPPEPPRRGPQAQRVSSPKAVGVLKLPSIGRGGGMPGSALAIAPPTQELAVQQSAIFGALGLWAVVQATLESPSAQLSETAGVQLSLALAYSVYTLKENKKMELGKAVALSIGGLVVGALIGTAVQNWLRVDIVPLGAFQSPGVFCTEFVIVGLLMGCLFLV
ncbi:hypothetical protein CEUSTIGMA_g7200.t1 [Chlamydomonas eustigma]|uniref:Uncharacterized protein n=1 Tax=Chlamydomonas eustigma TaxID=1157962 RepID=A0A250XA41_9CHLO|nr:hypothetical protein CEUSTIGMA_g7200.t1 [Chlamydomonas eustigma]|eukprot:GAX79759.1 hypothetical protein CEUSTIGMA_g7200.t1 [Chlamydomonas eustigma]